MGYESERPTNPPPSAEAEKALRAYLRSHQKRNSAWEFVKAYGPYVSSALTAILSAYAFVDREVQGRITSAVEQHDADWKEESHPKTRKRLTEDEAQIRAILVDVQKLQVDLKSERSALYELYWFRVGEKAAEIADPRKRTQAAAAARDKFERLVSEGQNFDEAYRRSIGAVIPR